MKIIQQCYEKNLVINDYTILMDQKFNINVSSPQNDLYGFNAISMGFSEEISKVDSTFYMEMQRTQKSQPWKRRKLEDSQSYLIALRIGKRINGTD